MPPSPSSTGCGRVRAARRRDAPWTKMPEATSPTSRSSSAAALRYRPRASPSPRRPAPGPLAHSRSRNGSCSSAGQLGDGVKESPGSAAQRAAARWANALLVSADLRSSWVSQARGGAPVAQHRGLRHPSSSAISETSSPPKNRLSTICACRGSSLRQRRQRLVQRQHVLRSGAAAQRLLVERHRPPSHRPACARAAGGRPPPAPGASPGRRSA